MIKEIHSFRKDKLLVKIYKKEQEMSVAAADFVSNNLQGAIIEKGYANLILATGTSQFLFLDSLKKMAIDWQKITVFHLDEYKSLSDLHPASFRKYLKERILDIVKPGKVYLINGDAENLEQEMAAYESALKSHPVDIACIGIGENGHIAFNDPSVADFNDSNWVKVVQLDEACRHQQLSEGWFPTFDNVPLEAVTLTIPAIMNCKTISCFVPNERKSTAVYNTLFGEILPICPSTILRRHQNAVLFLDAFAASKIQASN